MALRELLANLFVNVEGGDALAKVDKSIGTIVSGFKSVAPALASAFAIGKITSFLDEQIEAGAATNDLVEKLGVSVGQLGQFRFAAGMAGVGADEAATALQFLNKNMGLAVQNNQEAKQTFAEMGIKLKTSTGEVRDAADVTEDIADHFAKMGSTAEMTATAMKVFGKQGAALIPMLKGGGAEMRAMFAESKRLSSGLGERFTKAADKADDEMFKLKAAKKGLKQLIAFELIPAYTKLITKMTNFTVHMKDSIKNTNLVRNALGVLAVSGGLGAIKAFATLGKTMGFAAENSNMFVAALKGLGGLAIYVALALALYLIIDDFIALLEGDESVIGDFLEEFLGVEEARDLVQDLRDAWKELKDTFADSLPDLKLVLGYMLQALAAILPAIAKVAAEGIKMLSDMVHLVSALGKMLGAIWAGTVGDKDFSTIAPSIDKINKNFENQVANTHAGVTRGAGGSLAGDTQAVAQMNIPGQVVMPMQDVQVSQANTITINMTGTDEEMVEKLKGVLKSHSDMSLRDTQAALKTGKGVSK